MRQVTRLPLAVGFGISTADQARAVGAIADGVVVGSAFVRVIEQNAASARSGGETRSPGPRAFQWFTIEEPMSIQRLAECRKRIDAVDLKLLALLNERTRMVEEIGRIKQNLSLPIYEPKREDQVFHNVTSNNNGPLTAEAVKRIFERIIDEMRNIQRDKMF